MTTPLSVAPPPPLRILAGLGATALIGLGGAALVGSRRAAGPLDGAAPLEGAAPPDGAAPPWRLLDGTADEADLVAAVVGDLLRLAGLCGLPMIVLGAYLTVRLLRRAAWLDGTRLSVRGAVFTATADLAHADVSLRRGVLAAQDPGRGRPVRLPLRGLPPYELDLLARATGSATVADALRALAAGPFGPDVPV